MNIPGVDPAILKSLQPLFEKAEREDLWFQHTYYGDDVLLSPVQLKRYMERGKFRHGAPNWRLVPHPTVKTPSPQQAQRLHDLELEKKRIWDSITPTPKADI